ncbi:hypothetical protein ACFQZC_14420 [Streptacidiphilus monticola]
MAKIQRNTVPVTIAGMAQTNISTVTTVTFTQEETRCSRAAIASEIAIEATTTSAVKMTVRQTTCQNSPLPSTVVKPSKPMYFTIVGMLSST